MVILDLWLSELKLFDALGLCPCYVLGHSTPSLVTGEFYFSSFPISQGQSDQPGSSAACVSHTGHSCAACSSSQVA